MRSVHRIDEEQRAAEEAKRNRSMGDGSDDALAMLLADMYPEFRYCPGLGGWLRFDGTRYVKDTTTTIYERARTLVRDLADRDTAKRLRSAATIAAIERLARSDPAYARGPDAFDADPLLLNTPGGVVDLRTGEVEPHDHHQDLTRCTVVSPVGECPSWLAFLDTVTAGNDELALYLQRWAGYCLTGDVSEHAFMFAYGGGGNGKGVFLNTLRGIWGDFAKVAPMETFTEARGERHPTELAMLRGARLVIAQETEQGRRWAESKLKAITGGDPVSARFMRGDFFEYSPQFKLLMSGNYKPELFTVDEAMRRRMHLVPFTVTIPERERDPKLPDGYSGEADH